MKLEKLYINNFKSLVDVEIDQPNPFTVFVGPNGSGKSNIFEALEFLNYYYRFKSEVLNFFGGINLLHANNREKVHTQINKQWLTAEQQVVLDGSNNINEINISLKTQVLSFRVYVGFGAMIYMSPADVAEDLKQKKDYKFFTERFARIFIGKENLRKQNITTEEQLNIDATNLESVLKRILQIEEVKKEIIEIVQTLIPEFENVEIVSSSLSGRNELAVYEKSLDVPLTKNLISDGTYNILALLTALYQSNEPQFLCIEEPENGLHPFAIKQLVQLFRQQCEEKGHYIWLNTHSQTLVSELKPEEIITVNKENGATKIKQHKGENIYNLTMDEAWLSNALGGGVPW